MNDHKHEHEHTYEGDPAAAPRRHRRTDDAPAPVEVTKFSNGARTNSIIQTATLIGILVTLLTTFAAVVWLLAGLSRNVEANALRMDRIVADDELTRERVRTVEQQMVDVSGALERTSTTLERVQNQLSDTRDMAVRHDAEHR